MSRHVLIPSLFMNEVLMRIASTRPWFIVLFATLLLAPLAGQELPTANPEDVGMSSGRFGDLTDALRTYVERDRFPGAVAMVVRRGHVVYAQAVGYRDRESQSPMRTDAIFRIASQTKALVSVGVMMLQERDGRSHGIPAPPGTTG